MTTTTRRGTKGAKTREHVLALALELASRDGLHGITIGTLAEHAGMSKGGLFAHFASKEELQRQVLEVAIARFRAVVVEPVLAVPPGIARLRLVFERWTVWDGDDRLLGCPFVMFSAELDDQPGGARDLLVAAQARWMKFIASVVSEAADAARSTAADAGLFAFQLQGILLGYHHARRLLHDERAMARARAAFEALLVGHGLADVRS